MQSDVSLGLKGITEVVLGACDFASEQRRWQALLDPHRPSEQGLWLFDPGPALRVIPHSADEFLGLKLRVASLERARTYLEASATPFAIASGGIVIDPGFLVGLDVVLVD